MKLGANKVDGFIRSPDPNIKAVLVYGPDAGLVRERTLALSDVITDGAGDPFQVVEFIGSALAKDPARLVDEVLTISFTGARRVLVVRDGADDIVGAVTAVLENDAADDPLAALVVVAAGNLAPRSSLRRLFEGSDRCMALPCYPDDEAGLAQLVSVALRDEGITIESQALHAAVALMGADRQANRREIEKLVIYAGPGGHLSEEMVAACLRDSAEASSEEAVLAAADGDYESLVDHLARVWADGTEPVAVIRSAQRHFMRLHFVLSQTYGGVPLESAIKQLRPPLFWRIAGRFRSQLQRWSVPAIEESLDRLTEAELSAKSTGAPAGLVCDRALMAVAQLARTHRKRKNY